MPEASSDEFWNERYRSGRTPWDYGGVPPEFSEFLPSLPCPGRILIPGCGSGYELRAALDAGIDAFGIELSSEAAKRAQGRLGDAAANVFTGDFFLYPLSGDAFDAIYERTFLCAIPPECRPDYARRTAELLKPGGLLFGYFVYGEEPDPPPYPLAEGEEKELFNPLFDLLESAPSRAPLPLFEGMEQWQIWRRTA